VFAIEKNTAATRMIRRIRKLSAGMIIVSFKCPPKWGIEPGGLG